MQMALHKQDSKAFIDYYFLSGGDDHVLCRRLVSELLLSIMRCNNRHFCQFCPTSVSYSSLYCFVPVVLASGYRTVNLQQKMMKRLLCLFSTDDRVVTAS